MLPALRNAALHKGRHSPLPVRTTSECSYIPLLLTTLLPKHVKHTLPLAHPVLMYAAARLSGELW